ncbi:hypothetical protein CSR02_01065 [Acetobacter pomorum]|uniref:Uncharacterized protein n=1 Tax=Acetobacter pomorum TaxID=65959 RepID=A0A2G4RFR3_9PROT|nr:hypothetical protein [Acetobacter pomorum]PHY95416.1 hypothetical protein CSR02_01065 [Acetobacter pomorum]
MNIDFLKMEEMSGQWCDLAFPEGEGYPSSVSGSLGQMVRLGRAGSLFLADKNLKPSTDKDKSVSVVPGVSQILNGWTLLF